MNSRLQLRVKHSGLLRLQFFKDAPDGNLFIAEAGRHVPFAVKRIYFINQLANREAVRGKHAHRRLEQAIFCINGSFTLQLDDGRHTQRMTLDDPSCGVLLGPMLWHTMTRFSRDCVILVLASDHFDASDYIRDRAEFLRLARA
ncbi:MAG: FdtA/QdtA family cupin domain-containing protein [Verrucomicrobia bacterium]|nr:FdtA/QdtA family cupin domain-containing protein [Verrucomicrobiota bacterium]